MHFEGCVVFHYVTIPQFFILLSLDIWVVSIMVSALLKSLPMNIFIPFPYFMCAEFFLVLYFGVISAN